MQKVYSQHILLTTVWLTLLFFLAPSLVAAQYDAHSMCAEAAQGLLPEDAPTYIQNCISDYQANLGEEASALVGDAQFDSAESSDSRLVYEESDDASADNTVDDTEDRSEAASEVTE